MTEYKLIQADAREGLKQLEANSVHCCVTSPPYFGQRDYKVSGQIGLENSLQDYIDNLVSVFEQVRRVLREDGTFWLNVGDSYYNYRPSGAKKQSWHKSERDLADSRDVKLSGLKQKDLIGVPWMLAFALRDCGWWLRQELIWYKTNPMPGSMADRSTLAHEQIFLLTKNKDYFYDKYAIGEEIDYGVGKGIKNKLSVWKMTPARFRGAHFATFPVELPETCLLAGSPTGYCSECGEPMKRTIVKERLPTRPGKDTKLTGEPLVDGNKDAFRHVSVIRKNEIMRGCSCGSEMSPSIVLDPFSGAATTGIAAIKNSRSYIGIELNPEYIKIAENRLNEYRRSFEHL